MSQFDALLDFGDSDTTTTTTTTTTATTAATTETNGNSSKQEGGASDDFDPFGPSVTMETKSSGDTNLLVDFSVETEISDSQQQNGLTNDLDPFGIKADATTSSEKPSNNLLFDMSTGANPLYEMSNQPSEEPSNPLYEFSTKAETENELVVTTTITSSSASANPLYDYMENGGESKVEKVEHHQELLEPDVTSQNGVSTKTAQSVEEEEEEPQPQELETELVIREDELLVREDELQVREEPEAKAEPAEAQPEKEAEPEVEPEPVLEAEPLRIVESGDEEVVEHREIMVDEPEMVESAGLEEEAMMRDLDERDMMRSPSSSSEEALATKVTYRSSSYIALSPTSPDPAPLPDSPPSASPTPPLRPMPAPRRSVSDQQPPIDCVKTSQAPRPETAAAVDAGDMTRSEDHIDSRGYSGSGDQYGGSVSLVTGAEFVNSSYRTEPEENGTDEIPRDPNIVRETREKEEVHFTELSSVKNRFEAGQSEEAPHHTVDVREEYLNVEGGEYENEPVQRTDVVREADRNVGAELPEIGTARNLRAKFSQPQEEQTSARHSKREITPPELAAGGEYVSEPREFVEKYEGKAEAGVFENAPATPTDVVRSGEAIHEDLPEAGYTKNLAARFKQMESQSSSPPSPGKRELTPDRSGRVEYVSEPRGVVETYEGKPESGVFENVPMEEEGVVRSGQQAPDILPEPGAAKNLAAKWRQMESGAGGPPPSPGGKRAITPDRTGQVEYVSEPRSHVERYEGKAESGVFESVPQDRSDVVRSEDHLTEEMPEHGYTRNLAARFREMETQAKSPPSSAGHTKEITPPRDAGVYESQPENHEDVVRGDQAPEEILPQKGTARSMASRFLQIAEESKSPPSSSRGIKEFTPPRSTGGQVEVMDAGVRENQPQHRPDVLRESDPVNFEQELPERGMAKNVLSKFRQMESESAKQQSPGRVKEFTPPREEPRVLAARSPKTPSGSLANAGHVHPSELPGQYQPQIEESVFESDPLHRPDVVREADTDWAEGLPTKNTTRNMVDRFRTIQAESSKEPPAPVSRKEEDEVDHDRDSKTRKSFVAVQTEKCGTCHKNVYAMERLEMNKTVYHKNCFRCSHCKAMLTPKTFAVNNGTIFCTAHYKQLFARKGNYDEGFGREQHKQRWRSETNGTEEGTNS